MATYRPAVKKDDNIIEKIIKYIPAEVITVYTGVTGVLLPASENIPDAKDSKTYLISIIILLLITPVWTYFAVFDNPDVPEELKRKKALFHACISFIAFIIWIYALGDNLLKALMGCEDPSKCDVYNPALGSILLLFFSVLLVPLFERLIMGPPSKQYT